MHWIKFSRIKMEQHVAIDMSTPTYSSSFSEFVHRVDGAVRIYVLFKPHTPYYACTPFQVTRVDHFAERLHGLLNTATGDLPVQAEIKVSQHGVIVYMNHNFMVIDKVFIQPCNLLARPSKISSAIKRNFSQVN